MWGHTGSVATTPTANGAGTLAWFLGTNGLGWFGGGIANGAICGGLTSTDVTNIYNDFHTFNHAVNATLFP